MLEIESIKQIPQSLIEEQMPCSPCIILEYNIMELIEDVDEF